MPHHRATVRTAAVSISDAANATSDINTNELMCCLSRRLAMRVLVDLLGIRRNDFLG